jgi:hypothetical protein
MSDSIHTSVHTVSPSAAVLGAEDRLADFTRDRRVMVLSLMALAIGLISAVVAYALVWLIAVITNLSFYGI